MANAVTNSYPGSKHGSGSYQHIINEIPPISRLIVLFGGNCPVAKHFAGKIPVIVIEKDPLVIAKYWAEYRGVEDFEIIEGDSLTWLSSQIHLLGPTDFIYADPPYLFSVRKSNRPIYRHEMGDSESHQLLGQMLISTPAGVAISGYSSEFYDELFRGWRVKTWRSQTRSGTAIECLWMNYDHPEELQSYDFLGDDKTDRQRIRRKIDRWQSKLSALEPKERNAIIARIQGRWT